MLQGRVASVWKNGVILAPAGLTERDLYGILATWKELNRAGVTFEEAMVAGRHAGSYPVAPFVDFLRSLRG